MSDAPQDLSKKGSIAWMAGNSVTANLVMLALLAGGLIYSGALLSIVQHFPGKAGKMLTSLFKNTQITQEVFPAIELDRVQITVAYPGASPAEVEQGILLSIEEAIRGLDGVDEVASSAGEGSASVTVELLLGADSQKVYQEIQQEVDRIRTFPEDAEDPQIRLLTMRRQVLSLALYGPTTESALRQLAEETRDTLLADKDIAQVELSGVRNYEIAIEVPRDTLRAYNLTLDGIAQKIRAAAVEIPGGSLKTQAGEILLRVKERRDYARQFADLPILRSPNGSEVLLRDIAVVEDTFVDSDREATFDGQPAVLMDVYRIGGQTPIQVSDAVHRVVDRLDLPEGIEAAVRSDRSEIFRQRAELLLRNGYIGLALVLILLSLFLEPRLAFWVTMGIPISFLGGFLFLPAMDISINMVSMFAFIIALGIVVDDAIVVGENIYDYHEKGHSFLSAAIHGAKEVALPVTFSVLTNIVAFLPLAFVPGTMGKIFKNIPAVVVTVFAISLFESLYILPAHLGHGKKQRGAVGRWIHERQQRLSAWIARAIRTRYAPFLDIALHYRYVALATALAVLASVLGLIASGRMGMQLFPRVESDFAVVSVVLPYGTAVENTRKVRDRLIAAARATAEPHGYDRLVKGIFADVGRPVNGTGGSHTVEVRVYLTKPHIRPIGTAEYTEAWRKQVGTLVGIETINFESDRGGPGRGAALTVELSHRNIAILEKAGEDLAETLRGYPQVKDVNDGYTPGKRQYNFTILAEGRNLGLTARAVARQVRNSFYGAEVFRQQRGRNEVKTMVRLPREERISEHDLESLMLRTPNGTDVPLGEVVRAEQDRAYTAITRRNGRRTITVTSDVVPRSQANMILASVKKSYLPELQKTYRGLQYSFEGRQADMRESLSSLLNGFVLAMAIMYVLLAIPFNSYIQPLIIMVSIPFGVVGAVLGHLIMGYSLSIISMMGIVALAGVVVNDSLVLIDFANREYKRGLTAHDAVVSAGTRRFRPILLTTMTTFGGLAPMIFETSRQARFLIPMALSLGFGILFATFISLLIVPCLFMIIEDIRRVLGLETHDKPAVSN